MAMTNDQLRSIDNVRQRLSQFSATLSGLRTSLEREEPLPTWSSLQASANTLSFNLDRLTETLNSGSTPQLLREAHAYPLPTFPGHVQEGLLAQVLRKKLEPGAEKWVEEHTTSTPDRNGVVEGKLTPQQTKELWHSARPTSQNIIGPMLEMDGAMDDEFTIAEREAGVENVVTGLRRKLWESDSEDDDDEDEVEKMEDVMPDVKKTQEEEGVDPSLPPLPLDSVLRFMTTGELPAQLRQGR